MIPDEVISEIRDRADIVAVIGEHLQLRKAGVSHKGLCPFHQEKTPSFHVNPVRRSYYCFGCQKGGDVFSFVMELQGKTFIEAVRDLAKRTGVTLPERPATPEEQARRQERSRLHDVNAAAAVFYREHLGGAGRAYLESRGIGAEVAELFQLGAAPDEWDAFVRQLDARKLPLEAAVTVGLIAPRPRGPGYYDKFRNRLMCPIILPAGEIAGFSGRTLGSDPETAKYVNSPESPIYKKSHLLFGLHAARTGFRTAGRAILVEGNFDVIALHQAGFSETVAPLGTALTEHQAEVLRRFVPQVVLCLDGDKAGRAALLRAIELFRVLIAAGLDARVVALPDGSDPDTFVRERGPAALREAVDKARPAVEHYLFQSWSRSDRSAARRQQVLEQVAPLVAAEPNETTREMYLDQVARMLEVDPRLVRRAVAGHTVTVTNTPPKHPTLAHPPSQELQIIAILADHPGLFSEAEQLGVRSLLTDERLRDMYSAAHAGRSPVDVAPPELTHVVAKEVLAGAYLSVPHPRRTLQEAIRVLKSRRLEAEVGELDRAIRDAERRGDTALARELALRQVQTRNEAAALKRRPEEEPR